MNQSPILITGGAQRIGRYCAERLLDEGASVIITYRQERPAVDALKARGAVVLYADFSTAEGIWQFIALLRETTPSLRAVIHNASLWRADAEGMEAGQYFDLMFHVHMQAPYLINTHVKDLLDAAPEPLTDIIHITDFTSVKGSKRHSAYAASKAGMENLARSFAALFAPTIKVNALAPASIMLNEGDDAAYIAHLKEKSVLDVLPGPGAIWDGIRYLLDARFVTGTTLSIDGGRNVK